MPISKNKLDLSKPQQPKKLSVKQLNQQPDCCEACKGQSHNGDKTPPFHPNCRCVLI